MPHSRVRPLWHIFRQAVQLRPREPNGPNTQQELRGAVDLVVSAEPEPVLARLLGPGHPRRLRQPVLQEPATRNGAPVLRPGSVQRHSLAIHRQLFSLELLAVRAGVCRRHHQHGPGRGQNWVAGQYPRKLSRLQLITQKDFLVEV